MKLNRYCTATGLLAALAVVIMPANAQQTYKGKFTLDAEAHWGSADLKPGEYTITSGTVPFDRMLYVRGNDFIAIVPAATIESKNTRLGSGRLEITEINGVRVITRLSAASVDKEFTFAVPKSLAREGLGAAALKKAVIPVSAGK